VVSLRFGQRLNRNDKKFAALRGHWTCRLHIEDPYKWERNLHCVLGESEELKLRFSFVAAAAQLGAETATLPVGLKPMRSSEFPAPPRNPLACRDEVVLLEDSSDSEPEDPGPLQNRKGSQRRRRHDRRRSARGDQDLHVEKASKGKTSDARPGRSAPEATAQPRAQKSSRPSKERSLAPGALYIDARPVLNRDTPVLSRRLGKMGPRTVAVC
jgi:hypothetical protein